MSRQPLMPPPACARFARGWGWLCALGLGVSSGCIVLKQEHDDLVKRVDSLEKQVARRDQELGEATERAAEQAKELEKLLRSNQANVALRVEDLEYALAEVRGAAQDAQNENAALKASLSEILASLEKRLAGLEAELTSKSNIPEGKQDLLALAERELTAKNYRRARELFRIYLSRYPNDAREAEVRFKIGLSLYSERDFRAALGEFFWIVQNAPESSSIHDALYYSGLGFAKLGQCQKAIAYFNALTDRKSKAPENYKAQARKQIELLNKDNGELCADKAQGR